MIECENIIKQFGKPTQEILHSLNFTIKDGEFVSISGKSGSGKSTLMYIISTLDHPTGGKLLSMEKMSLKWMWMKCTGFAMKKSALFFNFIICYRNSQL